MPLIQVWVYVCAGCDAVGPILYGHKPPHDPRDLGTTTHGYDGWRLSQKKNHQCPDCVLYYTRLYGAKD